VNKPIRTVSIFCLLLFLALMINATYLQYWKAGALNDDARNRRVLVASYSQERGAILVGRNPIAESVQSDDEYKFQRTYPKPQEYAPLTGYFSYYSTSGLEQTQNDILSGQDDRLFVTNLVDLLSNDASKGGNVSLTIDPQAQDAAFQALQTLPGDVQASVVAIQPTTGRILAMASLPSYDPNRLATHDLSKAAAASKELNADPDQPLLNRSTQTRLPPGSTFKVVTAAAAIEYGSEDGKKKYDADSQVPGGATYQLPLTNGPTGEIDNEGRNCGTNGATITFRLAMENSCNTTFAQLAGEVGADNMAKTAEGFGFNQDYLTDLPRTAQSVFPADLDKAQLGQTGFGQFEVSATPLQMAMVAAGIANDGSVMKPYLVDEEQSADLEVLHKTDPEELSRAVSAQTANEVTKLMVSTVEDGTAYPGAISGVSVAGKTGTAQSGTDAPPYAWYVSFAPADDPQVAVAVMIQKADIARGEIAGGTYGGPIAKAVMEAVIK
jgi:penicillin-binding protein A